jgi:hypothetical protein
VEDESTTLTIETPRAGWRPATVLKLAFVLFWCVFWYRQGGGFASPVVLIGLAVGGWMSALGVDHVYTTFRLRIGNDSVFVERRSLLRAREWACSRPEFRVGELDTVDDGEGKSGIGAHRFISLHLGQDVVQFMEGHPEESLEKIRSQLVGFMGRGGIAA